MVEIKAFGHFPSFQASPVFQPLLWSVQSFGQLPGGDSLEPPIPWSQATTL